MLPGTPPFQPLTELAGQQDLAAFSLAADGGPTAADGLRRDIGQFRHPDAGGAKGLQHQQGALGAALAGSFQQTEIFLAGQFPVGIAKDPVLALERFCLTLRIAAAFLIAVHRRQHGVDTGR